MEEEFIRPLVIIMGVGFAIAAIGSTLVFLAFRTYGDPGSTDRRKGLVLGALIAFVALCCVTMLLFSFR